MLFILLFFLDESMEENEENEELPMKKRRRLALEDLSGDEEDSGDEYKPGICFK
jgi:hypothetical protein